MKTRHNSALLIFAPVVLLLASWQTGHFKEVNTGNREKYSGILKFELFYGAPGFGEDPKHDAKEPTYILHLRHPILFRDSPLNGSDEAQFDTAKTIHIRFDPESNINGSNLRKLVGKKVIVDCTLFSAHTGHHHAPVVTEVIYGIKQL